MTGFGGYPFGGDAFAGLRSPTPDVNDTILVQPVLALPHSAVLIAAISGTLVDTTQDDDFSAGPDVGLWSAMSTNASDIVDGGNLVTLHKNASGASYSLTSIIDYVSGDISVEYDIESEFMADEPTTEITYIALQMLFATGETLVIKRMSHANFGGHQIRVVYTRLDGYSGGATFQTTASTGKLRLIRHGMVIAAVKDDDTEPMFLSSTESAGDFNVQIFSSTNSANEYCTVRYRDFKSSTGVLFGDAPMVDNPTITAYRVIGTVPASDYVGDVDVIAFNHDGEIGMADSGFTFPLVEGQALSANDGLHATVQADSVIR